MSLYRQTAIDNGSRKANGDVLEGLAYQVDPEFYGL
jgi:hypothetical protein